MELILNDRIIRTDKPGGMTLLDFIRYENSLKGTKIGCREGDCGACTVLVGEIMEGKLRYRSMTSCVMPLINAEKKHIVTIEGLNMSDLSIVQKAFIEEGGTQCGFCTVGFIVSLTGFCINADGATYEDGVASIDGNICRCTGYKSIQRAVDRVVKKLNENSGGDRVDWLVKNGFVPPYFQKIPAMLSGMEKTAQNANGNERILNGWVGGGTDLYVQRPESLEHGHVNGFFLREDLKLIRETADSIIIGAASTVSDLAESFVMNKQFPELKKYIKLISSTQIRNMGTIAGNFINASPIGDLTIFFLALNAAITLRNSKNNERTVPLREFYKGYKSLDKKEDEHVITIQFDKLNGQSHFNFEKVSKRTNLDIASVNTAISIRLSGETISEIHASAGGIGPVPLYLAKTCNSLKGKELSPSNIENASEIMQGEISPISDARGTKEYKSLLLRQLFFAHFITLFPEKFEMENLV